MSTPVATGYIQWTLTQATDKQRYFSVGCRVTGNTIGSAPQVKTYKDNNLDDDLLLS